MTERAEEGLVQEFGAEQAVDALVVAVLLRLAGGDVKGEGSVTTAA